jgi:MFS family permease
MSVESQATAQSKPAESLRDITPQQWKSGIAALLGWLFDGLDMHLYVIVAAQFVAELIDATSTKDPNVGWYSSWIQAAFLVGWAVGGAFFGRVGDRLGRSRALCLTILTYAIFTGLSFFAQTWWQLLIFRFIAALGIGGEWAVGASLLSETWPQRWRPWLAAILQTGVNVGVLLASLTTFVLSGYSPRVVFLVGVLPALLVFWIRREVPESEEWHAARLDATGAQPGIVDLFRGSVRRISVLTIAVCALSLTGHWAVLFWYPQQLRNHPEVASWSDAAKAQLVSTAVFVVMSAAIAGNFLAALFAKLIGYRRAIAFICVGYFASTLATYIVPRSAAMTVVFLGIIGLFHGIFALFTMYLPPLFPTLLRTTGAGFCYNIGRIAAAVGTVLFGLFTKVGDYRIAILWAAALFVPAAFVAFALPELRDTPQPGLELNSEV